MVHTIALKKTQASDQLGALAAGSCTYHPAFCPALHDKDVHLLPTGSEERRVLGVESFPVAILPSCQDMKTIALLIEAYSQNTKHHSDLLTLMSLNLLPYDFGRIWAYIF